MFRTTIDFAKNRSVFLAVLALTVFAACSTSWDKSSSAGGGADAEKIPQILDAVRERHVPDRRLGIFNIQSENRGTRLLLKGEVDSPAAKDDALAAAAQAGFKVEDRIVVLPSEDMGGRTWGISSLSVANTREKPGHASEMATQILMGHTFKVWQKQGGWYLVQTPDRYLGWLLNGPEIVFCTKDEVDAWNSSRRLMVTAYEVLVVEQPVSDAAPVCDVVMGCLLKHTGEENGFYKVELPDRRAGYLDKQAAEDHDEWTRTRRPTPENIERTARMFMGRPYLWGGNSVKGLDCSGFTKMVFFMNGIQLKRNASHQATQGVEVPLDAGFTNLKKGDLLFFGRAEPGRPDRISHVGISLGGKTFIHSSGMVRISSLDTEAGNRDEHRIKTILRARRILPESQPLHTN